MITIDTWLYGELASYAGEDAQPGFARRQVELPEGATMQQLLEELNMPTEARGITFINGNLSAMPGIGWLSFICAPCGLISIDRARRF